MSDLVHIHTLRTRCVLHSIDTARTFVLKDNEDPTKAFEQMEAYVRKEWPKLHKCFHRVRCTRITETDFMYDRKKKEVVEV